MGALDGLNGSPVPSREVVPPAVQGRRSRSAAPTRRRWTSRRGDRAVEEIGAPVGELIRVSLSPELQSEPGCRGDHRPLGGHRGEALVTAGRRRGRRGSTDRRPPRMPPGPRAEDRGDGLALPADRWSSGQYVRSVGFAAPVCYLSAGRCDASRGSRGAIADVAPTGTGCGGHRNGGQWPGEPDCPVLVDRLRPPPGHRAGQHRVGRHPGAGGDRGPSRPVPGGRARRRRLTSRPVRPPGGRVSYGPHRGPGIADPRRLRQADGCSPARARPPSWHRDPADVVLNGITGSIGLAPTLAALAAGRMLALANKESLVAGGSLVTARRRPGQIVPVDSEHSALAQCLRGGEPYEVARLVLTASGGPFRGRSAARARAGHPGPRARPPDVGHGRRWSRSTRRPW